MNLKKLVFTNRKTLKNFFKKAKSEMGAPIAQKEIKTFWK